MENGEDKLISRLASLLSGHEGEKFYCVAYGEVKLLSVECGTPDGYPLLFEASDGKEFQLTADGRLDGDYADGECVLFPSKGMRDWGEWVTYEPKTFSEMMEEDFSCKARYCKRLASEKARMLVERWYGGNPSGEELGYVVGLDREGEPMVFPYKEHCASPLSFYRFKQAEAFLSRDENVSLAKEILKG